MSVHGKGDDGYILMDVLVALFLILFGFGALFASLTTAVNSNVKTEENLKQSIETRNERTADFESIRIF